VHELLLDRALEVLERLAERLGERREPRDARRELGLARREPLVEAAFERLVVNLFLERVELTGREQMRVDLLRAAQRVGRARVDGWNTPAIDIAGLLFLDDPRAHQTTSSPPAASVIVPSPASRNATARISFCAASTSESRTGPFAAMSSRRISTARFDMFLKIFSLISSSAAFSATDSTSACTSRRIDWTPRSSTLSRLSNTNNASLICSPSSGSCALIASIIDVWPLAPSRLIMSAAAFTPPSRAVLSCVASFVWRSTIA